LSDPLLLPPALLRTQQNNSIRRRTRNATPPNTPPTIAPVLLPPPPELDPEPLFPSEEPPPDDPPWPATLLAEALADPVAVDEPEPVEDAEVVTEAGEELFMQFVFPLETVRRPVEPPV
jgi:hypothetical protein